MLISLFPIVQPTLFDNNLYQSRLQKPVKHNNQGVIKCNTMKTQKKT